MLVLLWVQIASKGYQQTTKVATSMKRENGLLNIEGKVCLKIQRNYGARQGYKTLGF